ncbi:hypothetical protein KZZ20_00395 [Methylacidiphilum fumariolicum]|uniref:hypothetical protein n=1 Tax=Candidatus Methylacidiphilum fumarolicum TaxID=591154 RepID=UPI0012947C94|nr:hypothetical protein [Candidatus Methylacidiphilum fumarolicum]MBW6413990.1 hypothetical protein [Candidatus Methylacidiphilum fumarolicum]
MKETRLPIKPGRVGRTKWNRSRLSIPKAHCLEAAGVEEVESIEGWNRGLLEIKASGQGSYQCSRHD